MVKEIIVDFDGTLTNEKYGEGPGDVSKFTPKKGVDVLRKYEVSPVIVTGRSQDLRGVSEEWLVKYNIPFKLLVMMPDYEVFEWQRYLDYKVGVHRQFDVRFSLDDKKSVVTVLRNADIEAFLVTDNFADSFIEAWMRTDVNDN